MPLKISPISCSFEGAPLICPIVILCRSTETTRSLSLCPAAFVKANITFFSGRQSAVSPAHTLLPTNTIFSVLFAFKTSIIVSSCVYRAATNITSYISSGASSVTTGTRLTAVRGENIFFMRSPLLFICSAHFPRANSVTSFPARNRLFAILQPSTPAPNIKIFIISSPFYLFRRLPAL